MWLKKVVIVVQVGTVVFGTTVIFMDIGIGAVVLVTPIMTVDIGIAVHGGWLTIQLSLEFLVHRVIGVIM